MSVMQLSDLTSITSTVIKDLYQLETLPNLDWHPALEQNGCVYQSSICDRLADKLKTSPASLAKNIQQSISVGHNISFDIDNRGYLYLDANSISFKPDVEIAKTVLLYIQPPVNSNFTLYYYKYLSLIGLQLELLRLEKASARICIPSFASCLELDATQFYGKDGFNLLLNLILEAQHQPSLEDLYQFKSLKQGIGPNYSVVVNLTTDALSLPNIAQAISLLQTKEFELVNFNLRTTKLEGTQIVIGEGDFRESFDRYGLALLLYIAGLEHPLDLDWSTPGLENSLNLKWLSKSLGQRLLLPNLNPRIQKQTQSQSLNELIFIINNLHYMQLRAAFYGDTPGFLFGARKALSLLHIMLNKGEINDFSSLNILTSLTTKISSIIEGF